MGNQANDAVLRKYFGAGFENGAFQFD